MKDMMETYFGIGTESEGDRQLRAHRELRRKRSTEPLTITIRETNHTFTLPPAKLAEATNDEAPTVWNTPPAA